MSILQWMDILTLSTRLLNGHGVPNHPHLGQAGQAVRLRMPILYQRFSGGDRGDGLPDDELDRPAYARSCHPNYPGHAVVRDRT